MPGKESLDRLAAFQRSWARASEVGTDCILPCQGPTSLTYFLGPSSSPEIISFEDGTMCGLMCETGPVFWPH